MPLAPLFSEIVARYNALCPFRYCFGILVHFKMGSRSPKSLAGGTSASCSPNITVSVFGSVLNGLAW